MTDEEKMQAQIASDLSVPAAPNMPMDNGTPVVPNTSADPSASNASADQIFPEKPANSKPEKKEKAPKKEKKAKKSKKGGKSLSQMDVKDIFAKITGKSNDPDAPKFSKNQTFEINLVPSVKDEMLKAMRFRNITLFICIIAFSAALLITGLTCGLVGGQSAIMEGKDATLKALSRKVQEFDSLDDFLTLKSQLDGIQQINDGKKTTSRVFSIISAFLPTGSDKVSLSKVTVNMEENTLTVEGQADAGVSPFIDYRVLEAFKKGAEMTKYDYGRYVDKDGNEIPSRCVIEANPDNGNTYREGDGDIYAYITAGRDGCDASVKERTNALSDWEKEADADQKISKEEYDKKVAEIYDEYSDKVTWNWYDKWLKEKNLHRYDNVDKDKWLDGYNKYYDSLSEEAKRIVKYELDQGVKETDINVIKVYRTPQFNEWIKENWEDEDKVKHEEPRMDLSGNISQIPHFESKCISYSGEKTNIDGKDVIKWTTDNECMVLAEEMNIIDSSNGLDSSENLVLRFRAMISINSAVLSFANKHMIEIGPNGQNVTDSYRQIEGMFEQRAEDCKASDVICTEVNATGGGQ